MSMTVAEPKKITSARERVAKYTADAEAEQAELVRLTDERRSMMSVRSPRGRHIVAQIKATERRLRTARERQERAEEALEAAQMAQRKFVEVPEFTVTPELAGLAITVPSVTVELVKTLDSYEVLLSLGATYAKLGRIHREGTGWTAVAPNETPGTFTGDHYPTRTGKHTQTYALAWLVARRCGFTGMDAAYNLAYEGVSA